MVARAGIVVTGTEVLTGRVPDRNGPWLAEALRRLGVDVGHVVVVGDRPDDLSAALRFLADTGADLVITTGGLGPTADDLTAQLVGQVQGRAPELDVALEGRITEIVARLSRDRGWRMDPGATAAGTRKQAVVPAGAEVIEPVGTAPGLVVPVADGRTGPPVLVLPGPPGELRGMWPAALESPRVRAALAGATELRQRTVRLWGTPESELAATLRGLEGTLDGLEITTCLRGGELEVVTRFGPEHQAGYDALVAAVHGAHGSTVFSTDGAEVDELLARALDTRGWTIATAESCTAGMLVARLTDPAGSSVRVLGGIASYSNGVKTAALGVPAELIDALGAVSAEVAVAMASGVRERLGADVGVGITGIAGPGGGSADKPVGLVHVCVQSPLRSVSRELHVPGGRADVRERTVRVVLQLLLELVAP
ncbi:competence/damage-inducible protein A [Rhodococcus antarcticus]|jgi:nicotinamide-nucleotide amidase|uniref:CinA-like protein n=1 Tax=Rhodococcus antarcticus TaxID=2987751 RepID=A0ABY6NWZ0_9NOCA|nr:competence/damage-inducible protein A [Rhodococcus antarcticus]UZJ23907.1 competence/damage-inducible protein A [Rhodococcus antarcticus]